MGLRRKSREIALQFLFGHDFKGSANDPGSLEQELDQFCNSFETGNSAFEYARELIMGISQLRVEIDQLLISHSHNWRLERMSLVDRNILRMAVYEMKYRTDVPVRVAINEALEIAKLYSIQDSVGFINGILDAVQLPAGQVQE